MLLSINWLKEFTPYAGKIDELAHCLTMLGLEVEEQIDPFDQLKDIVLGKIVSCHAHPQADNLRTCQVDIGAESTVSIVCGAPNVEKGQMVPVAPLGSTLPGGMRIKKAKIRGQVSEGMICSEQELALGEEHSGIMVLPLQRAPGTPFLEAMNLDDLVFDVGITPNRGDCLSVLGLAREVAAYFRLPLHLPDIKLDENSPSAESRVKIKIDNPDLCPLYLGRIIKDIQIRQSPAWMRYRLQAVGIRPVNNVVDITNYVLMELGHPLHAFDLDLISGGLIRVDTPVKPFDFITLDDQQRKINQQDLMIWDRDKAVAIAGVMGGANSEINPLSQNTLLECAVFDPGSIRRTARRLGLSSEASYRFERGVDQTGADFALNRAASLIQDLAEGQILQGITRDEPKPWTPVNISFRPQRSRDILALNTDDQFCRECLQALNCTVQEDAEAWKVTPPGYRHDLSREVDIIEEVGRMYGLEKTPSKLPRIAKSITAGQEETDRSLVRTRAYNFQRRIKTWAQGLGFKETVNYSFVSAQDLKNLAIFDDKCIPIQNPLSSDMDSLRPELAPGLLKTLRTNIDQGFQDLRLFEIARSFVRDGQYETMTREKEKLGLLIHGSLTPPSWPWPEDQSDFQEIKGIIQHLLANLQLKDTWLQQWNEHPYLSLAVQVMLGQDPIGIMGKIRPENARMYHINTPVWFAEMDLDKLQYLSRQRTLEYRALPKFPPVHRDMTIITPPQIYYSQICQVIDQTGISLLQGYELVDVYQPEQAGERNLTLRMTYRNPSRTLTDKEVDQQHGKLGQALLSSLPVRFP